jgi:NTE family protein
MVLLGIGAGTLFPVLSGTAVASAPGESFATATGMNSVARQVGAALGVAIVIAIIGTPTPTPAIAYTAFRHAWAFGAVCLFVAGLDCLLVGRVQAGRAPGRVTAPDRARSAAGRVIAPGAGDPAALRGVRGGVPRPDPAVLGHPSGGPRAARGESTHAPPVRREMAVPRA